MTDQGVENSRDLREIAKVINEQIKTTDEAQGKKFSKDLVEEEKGKDEGGWRSRYAEKVHEVETKKHEEATRDGLTGLLNKINFNNNLDEALDRTIDVKENLITGKQVALLMIDLDHFKKINDEHGHDVGDQVLQKLASILVKSVRSNDLVGRLGGEEFAVALLNTDMETAMRKAEEIRLNVEKGVGFQGEQRKLDKHKVGGLPSATVSIGVAISNRHSTAHRLNLPADHALYKSKERGRNTVIGNGPGTERVVIGQTGKLEKLVD